MPIYEYRCSACGHEMDALQKMSEPKLLTCPACHADALVKKVSAAGFQLKGSGWYVTDFRNGNKGGGKAKPDAAADAATATAAAGDAKADSSSGDTAKTDSKSGDTAATTPAPAPAAKTDSAPAASAPAPAKSTPSSSST